MTVINPVHIAFVAIVALIFLGPKRLPELAKSLGNGMREFRAALSARDSDEDGDHTAGPQIAAAVEVPPVPEPAPVTPPVPPPAAAPQHAQPSPPATG